jgi:alcohol dehydrogenase
MAYAALCSGICLAQAGLGAVHGLASPLGALFPVPHGVACGATLAATTRANLAALEERAPESGTLLKYAVVARVFLDAGRLSVPRLSSYGIVEADIPAIVSDSRGSSMKTNPIVLTDTEIAAILRASL